MNLLYAKRRLINAINLTMSLAAMGFGLFWLAWILITLFKAGIGGISLAVFTQMTPPPGSSGGLLNPILGSLMMTTLGTLIGTPVGIMAGIYLAEYGQRGW
ncbi:MAG: phosphate ABC transporter permease PtsA, partial [Thiobacillaceae bacterium]